MVGLVQVLTAWPLASSSTAVAWKVPFAFFLPTNLPLTASVIVAVYWVPSRLPLLLD